MGSHYEYPQRYDSEALEWMKERVGEWRRVHGR